MRRQRQLRVAESQEQDELHYNGVACGKRCMLRSAVIDSLRAKDHCRRLQETWKTALNRLIGPRELDIDLERDICVILRASLLHLLDEHVLGCKTQGHIAGMLNVRVLGRRLVSYLYSK